MARARRKVMLTDGNTELAVWVEGNKVVIREAVAFGDKTRAEIQQNIVLAIMEASGCVRVSGHDIGKPRKKEKTTA